ncbi:hypothetical protein DY000_02011539 [Brassica cretica]|uniref:DOG1 domain-containing protein n=1 Tax=Brassica cretica TaxID=69181 RepID=A0ABQ7CPK1_BRACR|nr:hypothetical protein DY000_02011539 [Brassica cretica]
MSSTIFSSKKPQEWSETIRYKCLPLLHQASSSSLLKEAIDGLVQEIISHFNTLEDSTIDDLLSASECKSMDTTFLLIGDIHPFLLTNLLRIFIHLAQPKPKPKSKKDEEDGEHVSINMLEDHHLAWREPSHELLQKIEKIERRVSMLSDDMVARFKHVQRSILTQVQEDTINEGGAKRKKKLEDEELKKEIQIIFKYAKMLRISVLLSIMEAINDHQRVLFLQGLCQMLLALKDKVCDEDKRDNNALLATFINGLMNVPSYISILGSMSKKEKEITACMFASAVIGSAGSTFVSSSMKSKGLRRTLKDATWASLCFFLGGVVLLGMGLLVKNRWVKMGLSILMTSMVVGVAISSKKKQEKKSLIKSSIRWFIIVAAISINVGFSDIVHRLRASPKLLLLGKLHCSRSCFCLCNQNYGLLPAFLIAVKCPEMRGKVAKGLEGKEAQEYKKQGTQVRRKLWLPEHEDRAGGSWDLATT